MYNTYIAYSQTYPQLVYIMTSTADHKWNPQTTSIDQKEPRKQ